MEKASLLQGTMTLASTSVAGGGYTILWLSLKDGAFRYHVNDKRSSGEESRTNFTDLESAVDKYNSLIN
jgi:hypothetical protein